MAEITYLMGSDTGGAGFFTSASTYFSGRSAATVVTTSTLEEVLDDLRSRATAGEIFPVVNLVSQPATGTTLAFPLSATHTGAGTISVATLEAALSNAGAAGYPAILGVPAVTEATRLCLYGPDVGTDAAFVTRLALLFGPELTVYAPLHTQDFQDGDPLAVDDPSQFRKTIISSPLAPSDHPFPPPEPQEPTMAQLFGKYRATVVDTEDPTASGRLQVDIPGASVTGSWAVASLPPIPASLVQVPPTGSTIWVEFEEGDVNRPLWTGVAWGTAFGPDVTLAAEGSLTLRANALNVQADGDLDASVGGSSSVTTGAALSVRSGGTTQLEAGNRLELKSAAKVVATTSELDVIAGVSQFTGTVMVPGTLTAGIVMATAIPGYVPH